MPSFTATLTANGWDCSNFFNLFGVNAGDTVTYGYASTGAASAQLVVVHSSGYPYYTEAVIHDFGIAPNTSGSVTYKSYPSTNVRFTATNQTAPGNSVVIRGAAYLLPVVATIQVVGPKLWKMAGESVSLAYSSSGAQSVQITAIRGNNPYFTAPYYDFGYIAPNTSGTVTHTPDGFTYYIIVAANPDLNDTTNPDYTGGTGGINIYTEDTFCAVYPYKTLSATAIAVHTPFRTYANTLVGGIPNASPAASSLIHDAHRRPCAVVSIEGKGIVAYTSRDAGSTYVSTAVDAQGKYASLLIDTRQNRFRVIYSKGASGLMLATGMLGDSFTQDTGSPSALKTPAGALLSGAFPVACPHPTDKDYVLLVYAAGTSLTAAYSIDAGSSWSVAAASVATADLTKSGRPALAFSGNSASLVYGIGNNLYAALSKDRGMTWQPPTIVTGTGPYQSLSLLAFQGRLYLLAFTGSTPAPVLFVSPDLGATWAQVTSTFPAITPPSGIGVVPSTGTLRLGLTHTSSDDGLTWIAA